MGMWECVGMLCVVDLAGPVTEKSLRLPLSQGY